MVSLGKRQLSFLRVLWYLFSPFLLIPHTPYSFFQPENMKAGIPPQAAFPWTQDSSGGLHLDGLARVSLDQAAAQNICTVPHSPSQQSWPSLLAAPLLVGVSSEETFGPLGRPRLCFSGDIDQYISLSSLGRSLWNVPLSSRIWQAGWISQWWPDPVKLGFWIEHIQTQICALAFRGSMTKLFSKLSIVLESKNCLG